MPAVVHRRVWVLADVLLVGFLVFFQPAEQRRPPRAARLEPAARRPFSQEKGIRATRLVRRASGQAGSPSEVLGHGHTLGGRFAGANTPGNALQARYEPCQRVGGRKGGSQPSRPVGRVRRAPARFNSGELNFVTTCPSLTRVAAGASGTLACPAPRRRDRAFTVEMMGGPPVTSGAAAVRVGPAKGNRRWGLLAMAWEGKGRVEPGTEDGRLPVQQFSSAELDC
jgi:hypothetical protein